MRERVRDGVRLRYEEAGGGEPPIVFVHGWCCDHTYFGPQFEHFSYSHRVVALDQRGFGESDKPEQEYTIEGFADDLRWLCSELELSRPVIVGHSMGGAVALATAARSPELPAALVLCDPAVLLPEAGRASTEELSEALAGPDYTEHARTFIVSRLFAASDDPERRERIIGAMLATPQRVMHSAFRNLLAFDSEAATKSCAVPVLLIDAEVPIPDGARFRSLCAQLVTGQTVGAGHFHQLEVPEQVNAMIDAFLRAKLA